MCLNLYMIVKTLMLTKFYDLKYLCGVVEKFLNVYQHTSTDFLLIDSV